MATKFKKKSVVKRNYKKEETVLKFSSKLKEVVQRVEQYLNIIRAKLRITK